MPEMNVLSLGASLVSQNTMGKKKKWSKWGKLGVVLCIYRSLELSVDVLATLEYLKSCDGAVCQVEKQVSHGYISSLCLGK